MHSLPTYADIQQTSHILCIYIYTYHTHLTHSVSPTDFRAHIVRRADMSTSSPPATPKPPIPTFWSKQKEARIASEGSDGPRLKRVDSLFDDEEPTLTDGYAHADTFVLQEDEEFKPLASGDSNSPEDARPTKRPRLGVDGTRILQLQSQVKRLKAFYGVNSTKVSEVETVSVPYLDEWKSTYLCHRLQRTACITLPSCWAMRSEFVLFSNRVRSYWNH